MNQKFSHAKHFIARLKNIEMQIDRNQLQDAAKQLNVLVKTAANDPRLFLLGSRLAEAAKNPAAMLQSAHKAHELAPYWPVASIYLAEVLVTQHEAEKAMAMAEQAVEQAVTQSSLDVELLTKAAVVAQRVNHHTRALQWLREAEAVDPGNVSVRYKIGLTLAHVGEDKESIDIFTELLCLRPANPALLLARMRAYLHLNQAEEAIADGDVLLSLEPGNETYQFYLDIAHKRTPVTQPGSVVTGLFDGYAEGFDRHLVGQLHYKLPRDVAAMINHWHPDRQGDVLDLGCGTGLLGLCLGPINGVLVGVDLSAQMIAQASMHRVYDSFHQVNLLDALRATPENLYHVISALDVLIYVGSLDTVIPDAYRILLSGGRFVFSCEAGLDQGPDYSLQMSYRYCHSRSYVLRLLDEAGFGNVEVVERVLRVEAGEPVQGFLVTAQKPVTSVQKALPRKRPSKKE